VATASTRGVFLRDHIPTALPAHSHGQLDVSLITCVTTAYLTVAVTCDRVFIIACPAAVFPLLMVA
jgi:hypothetical protein